MSRTGHEIVYCSTCSTRLRGPDFDKGRAFKANDQVFCASCRPDLADEAASRSLSASRAVIPVPPPQSSSQHRLSRPLRKPSSAWLLGGIIAAVFVLGSILFLQPSETPTGKVSPVVARGAAIPGAPPEALPLRPKGADLPPIRDPGEEARLLEERLRRKSEDPRASEAPRRNEPTSKAETGDLDREPPDEKTPRGAPPPAPIAGPPEAFAPEWGAALAPTRARDFETALATLRKGPALFPDVPGDLALLRQAADLHREAFQILARIPKGQDLVLAVREDAGRFRRVEGTLIRVDSGHVALKADSNVEEVELGEVLPSSFTRVFEAVGKAPAEVPSAVACLLEGETQAARKILRDRTALVPDRYWAYASHLSEAQLNPDPIRALHAQALQDLASFETTSRGAGLLQALLRDHANDPFVMRNKVSFVERSQRARDFLFLAEDLRAVGALRAAKGGKGETFWTSEAEPDAAMARENYLEAVFSTVPDAIYKCWVLAGGCCLETFEFSCQGSEFLGPAVKGTREPAPPGSHVSLPLRPWISGLKKSHSAHTGPKHPARWEWVQVPLPKYANAGAQRLRIISEQKGFSVASICVTATRTGPPSDADFKEWIRLRGDRPKVDLVQPPKVIPLLVCKFDGTDRSLVGTLEKGSLSGIPLFEKCFLGLERAEPFTVPPKGELWATYYLRAATPLSFRLRLQRGPDQTLPYDFVVEKPAIGLPTEIRIPFSEFRAIFQPGTPAAVPGDKTTMIYIFGEAIGCGLRLDALSFVEIRAPEGLGAPVRTVAEVRSGSAGAGPWTPIFDGQSLRGFVSAVEDAWHVQEGRLVHDNSADNAAQSQEEFGDGEIRVRFETKGVSRFYFVIRQDGKGGSFSTSLAGTELSALEGGEHELLFSFRGDQVTATLDGKARPVEDVGHPRRGRIQFNSFDGSFRIRALDYRVFR